MQVDDFRLDQRPAAAEVEARLLNLAITAMVALGTIAITAASSDQLATGRVRVVLLIVGALAMLGAILALDDQLDRLGLPLQVRVKLWSGSYTALAAGVASVAAAIPVEGFSAA